MLAQEITRLVPLRPISRETHPWRRRWLGTCAYWGMQAAGWGGFFLLSISTLLWMTREEAVVDVLDSAAVAVSGIVTTHLLRVVLIRIRRRPVSWLRLGVKLLPWIVAAGFAIGGVISWVSVCWLQRTVQEMERLAPGGGLFVYLEMVTRGVFFAGVWVALYFGTHFYREHQEGAVEREKLRTAAREAQLNALRAQLNPHFLFNSLNVIRAMVPVELTRPRQAVTSLSELLRATLRQGGHEQVSLAEELEMVEHHLRLEQFRHEERLRVERRVDADTLACAIPPFVVQTLVENAINHGIAQRKAGGVVAIAARIEDGRLCVEVTNPGTIREGGGSTGVGLANARARLALLWGNQASLALAQAEEDLVRARLVVPVERILPVAPREEARVSTL